MTYQLTVYAIAIGASLALSACDNTPFGFDEGSTTFSSRDVGAAEPNGAVSNADGAVQVPQDNMDSGADQKKDDANDQASGGDGDDVPDVSGGGDGTPSKEIEFGVNEVYHLGNNDMQGSSCLSTIKQYPILGSKFFFGFEVLNNDTKINIAIELICGVDYKDMNFVSIVDGQGSVLAGPVAIAQLATALTLPAKVYAQGNFQIKVESLKNPNNNDDRDDFVVGHIKVKADNLVVKGQVRTE